MASKVALQHKRTVLLADDHPAMLKTVSDLLTPHFDVVAAVTDGRAALNAAALENPDVALLDIAMPVLDGIQAAREMTHRTARTRIVFLTGQEDDDYVSEALALGAEGYVFKRRMHSDLVPAVNLALNGPFFVSPMASSSNATQN